MERMKKSFPRLKRCGSIEADKSDIAQEIRIKFPRLKRCGSIEAGAGLFCVYTYIFISTFEKMWFH